MPRITEIVSEAKAFANTNAGQIVISGLTGMATMALSAVITKKFFPNRASFERAVGSGICAVGVQTLLSAAIANAQQERPEDADKGFECYRKSKSEKIIRLRKEIFQLQEKLSQQREELENANARIGYDQNFMDETMEYVEELRRQLCMQGEELEKVAGNLKA